MKTLFISIASAALAVGLAASAQALPRLSPGARDASTAPTIEKARVVCNHRRCYRTGYYRPYYYRPYGYYRPYYYGPHIGVGIGPLGVGIF